MDAPRTREAVPDAAAPRYPAAMRRRAALALICLPALPAAAFRLDEPDAATREALAACTAGPPPAPPDAGTPTGLCRFCGCPAPAGRADHGEGGPPRR
jgi:hypothetical protein